MFHDLLTKSLHCLDFSDVSQFSHIFIFIDVKFAIKSDSKTSLESFFCSLGYLPRKFPPLYMRSINCVKWYHVYFNMQGVAAARLLREDIH